MIRFLCPSCGERYEVEESQAGRDVKCAKCSLVFPIPAAGAPTMGAPGPIMPPPAPSSGGFQGGYAAGQPSYPPQAGGGYYSSPSPQSQRNTVGKVGMWLGISALALLVVGYLIVFAAAAGVRDRYSLEREMGTMMVGGFLVIISGLVGLAGLICSLVGLSGRYERRAAAIVGTVLASLDVVVIIIALVAGTLIRQR